MDDNTVQRPMTIEEMVEQAEADLVIPVPNPEWSEPDVTTEAYDQPMTATEAVYRTGYNSVRYQEMAYAEMANFIRGRHSKVKVEEVEYKDLTPEQMLPKKMTKVKEWSISARALKRVIGNAAIGRARYDYKFQAVYDPRFRIYRIWNVVTQNVVATVKNEGTYGKVCLRYRANSYYAPMMAQLNGRETTRGGKIIAIQSKNLHIHRGRSAEGTSNASKSKEAQLGFRRSMYEQSVERQRQKQAKLRGEL